MERGEYRPQGNEAAFDAGLPQAGSDLTRSAGNPFDVFVERLAGDTPDSEERGVQVADPFITFSLMDDFNFHYEYHHWNELGFKPTEEQDQFVKHVKIAYGIIAHPFSEIRLSGGQTSHVHQRQIEHVIALEKVYEGSNRVVLTDAEREILVKIANAAGIPCDSKRNEYFFDEIPVDETYLVQHGGYEPPSVVDADK